jgi:hypothetical protein
MFTFQPDSDLVAKPLHVSPFMVCPHLIINQSLMKYGHVYLDNVSCPLIICERFND